jgi:protease secretion system membrane fusion protein
MQNFMSSTQPRPADNIELYSDASMAARFGLLLLGIGFGGFLLWAALAPLDSGVPTQGTVTVDTKRKAVQHFSGGILKEVLVREGDQVVEGQTLMVLDEDLARSNYQSVRQKYLGLRAAQSRLQSEQRGTGNISYHPDLQEGLRDPQIQSHIATQNQLLSSRRAGLRADLDVFEQSIEGQKGQLFGYESLLKSRRSQLALLVEELNSTRELVRDGYAPRNRQLELERNVAETQGAIAELMGNITRTQRSIAELRQRGNARMQEYRKEVESQLADVNREVEGDADKYVFVKADLNRAVIKAPATGQVVGLTTQSVGAVVQAGQKLMDIVPNNEPLLVESRVEPQLIDRVQTGLKADVRFSAFLNAPQLVLEGEVLSVSSDLLTDPQTGVSYYLARTRITPQGMRTLGGRQMQAGMTAEVIIKTGERSALQYITGPFLKRLASAMKEE